MKIYSMRQWSLFFLALLLSISGVGQSASAQSSNRGSNRNYDQLLVAGYNVVNACAYDKNFQACEEYDNIISILQVGCGKGNQTACEYAADLIMASIQANTAAGWQDTGSAWDY